LRTPAALALLVTLIALPIADLRWCPDGCAEGRTQHLALGSSCAHRATCGACLNSIAVRSEPVDFEPVFAPIAAPGTPAPRQLSQLSPLFDPPPRIVS
jgi:hypothetical protein